MLAAALARGPRSGAMNISNIGQNLMRSKTLCQTRGYVNLHGMASIAPRLSQGKLLQNKLLQGGVARACSTAIASAQGAVSHWPALTAEAGRTAVGGWLIGSCGVVFSMVILGGVTRLTKSGLSMTEWKPLSIKPPMSDAEWEEEFEKYKQFPEFYKLNPDMTMAKFKPIYWFEYSHRLLGRALGVIFAVPAAYFAYRGYITRALAPRLGLLFCAGGTQGAIGWWMVKSGLEDVPTGDDDITRVSPYRLATHLTSAFLIYSTLVWTGLGVLQRVPAALEGAQLEGVMRLRAVSKPLVCLIGVTAVSGAFVAGMKAGHHYNSFPLMDGQLVPEGYFEMQPFYRNFFENIATVQFDHRVLATTTFSSVWALWCISRRVVLPPQARLATNLLAAAVSGQFALGIVTLLNAVPVSLGAAHQGGALTVFTVALYLMHTLRLRNPAAARKLLAQIKAANVKSTGPAVPPIAAPVLN